MQELIDILNENVGKRNWVLVLTADHGAQLDYSETGAFPIPPQGLEADLNARFDDGDDAPAVLRVRTSQVYMNLDEMKDGGYTLDDVARYINDYTKEEAAQDPSTVPASERNDRVIAAAFPSESLSAPPVPPRGPHVRARASMPPPPRLRGRARRGARAPRRARPRSARRPRSRRRRRTDAIARRVCGSVKHELLLRVASGYFPGRSGQVQYIASEPNFVDGGLTHSGPVGLRPGGAAAVLRPGLVQARARIRSRRRSPTSLRPRRHSWTSTAFRAPDGRALTEALVELL